MSLMTGLYIAMIVLSFGNMAMLGYHFPERTPETYRFAFTVSYCLLCFAIDVYCMIHHNWMGVVMYSVCCVIQAYSWWNDENNRRKRRRLKDKAAAKITEIAGRLKVVRPATQPS